MDAAIMNGATLQSGAVALVSNIANPIKLARLIMEKASNLLRMQITSTIHNYIWDLVHSAFFYFVCVDVPCNVGRGRSVTICDQQWRTSCTNRSLGDTALQGQTAENL